MQNLAQLFRVCTLLDHYVRLLPIAEPATRDFCEEEARREHWSVRQLDRQVNSMLYERVAGSHNKRDLLRKAERV
jgi:predicted nuclease of restriction endonuclease-like (RecB) superfamily